MNQYIAGSVVELRVLFKDLDGNLVDPTEVVGEVRAPDGSVIDITAQIQRESLGTYTAPYTPELSGLYIYRFVAEGSVIAAGEGRFNSTTYFEPLPSPA